MQNHKEPSGFFVNSISVVISYTKSYEITKL